MAKPAAIEVAKPAPKSPIVLNKVKATAVKAQNPTLVPKPLATQIKKQLP